MKQPKDTEPNTAYDEAIGVISERLAAKPNTLGKVALEVLKDRRIGWLAGFQAHGEHGCGSESCKCRLDGVEAGLEQAAEGKVGVRP